LISIPNLFAFSFTPPVGRTLNPKITAFSLASARERSLSVTPPTPELMICTFTSSFLSFANEPLSASKEPATSALRMTGKFLI